MSVKRKKELECTGLGAVLPAGSRGKAPLKLKPFFNAVVKLGFFYLYSLGWHTLPSHANAEACLTGWPNA